MTNKSHVIAFIVSFLIGGFFLLTFLPLTPNAHAGGAVAIPTLNPWGKIITIVVIGLFAVIALIIMRRRNTRTS